MVILQDEERYASALTTNQQRAMHCSFIEQQKLLALKSEEKLFHMKIKGTYIFTVLNQSLSSLAIIPFVT